MYHITSILLVLMYMQFDKGNAGISINKLYEIFEMTILPFLILVYERNQRSHFCAEPIAPFRAEIKSRGTAFFIISLRFCIQVEGQCYHFNPIPNGYPNRSHNKTVTQRKKQYLYRSLQNFLNPTDGNMMQLLSRFTTQ